MRKFTTILASFAISGALVACSPAETGEAAAEEDAVEEVEVIDDAMEEHGNDDRQEQKPVDEAQELVDLGLGVGHHFGSGLHLGIRIPLGEGPNRLLTVLESNPAGEPHEHDEVGARGEVPGAGSAR